MTRRVLGAVLTGVVLAQCAPAHEPADARLDGARLEVLAAWSGVEQRRFEAVLRHFADRTGATVHYTSAGSAGVPLALSRRLAEGDPPDLALLPQPGLLRDLAAGGFLVRPGPRVVAAVRDRYGPVWQRLGSYAGTVYGVWFKAAHKSLLWYDVAAFEQAGVVPPADLPGLRKIAHVLTATGRPAFAVSAGEAWTLTDWFEDLYLRVAGPHHYDLLANHRIAWTDPSVLRTLRVMAALLRPADIAGGISGARRTSFEASVDLTFGAHRGAAMLHGADFVAGVIGARTHAELGVDADAFVLPGLSAVPTIVGGGDVAVELTASRAGDELLEYLATPEAAAVWARRGGFLSPNVDLDLSIYPDDITRSGARSLLDAGAGFRFDLSDLQPAGFGGREDAGMQRELVRFLGHPDAAATAARLEAAATAAYAGARAATVGFGRQRDAVTRP
jgi:ABC-type glycerol-3-phosphate transport system substrate-binding protein